MKAGIKTQKVNLLKSSRRITGTNGSPAKEISANGKTSSAKIKATKAKLVRQGVKYCLGAYVDIHGVPKGKFVPIDHFELIFNGRVIASHHLNGARTQADVSGRVEIPASGWLVLRAWNDHSNPKIQDIYPYASTSPIYVTVDQKLPRSPADAVPTSSRCVRTFWSASFGYGLVS